MKKEKNDQVERRKYIRIRGCHVLHHEKYALKEHSEQKAVEGIVKDYSGGGALFESKIKYDIGDLLKLEIAIPGWDRFKDEFYKEDKLSRSEPIVALVSVVRIECITPKKIFDVGVFFVGIDEGDRWALIKKIKTQLNKEIIK